MSENPPELIAVLGNDDGLVQEAALKWYARLTEGTDDFSHETLDGNVNLVDEAVRAIRRTLEALQTMPFFGGKKVVWLKGCTFLSDSPTGRSQDTLDALEDLSSYIQSGLPPQVHLLLTAYEVDKRRAFYKMLGKIGLVTEYNKPDISRDGWQVDVAQVTKKAAQDRGISFERDALELFVNRVSESSRQIFSELDKLDLYMGERRTITAEDVSTLVPLTRAGVIFEISRSLEKGDVKNMLFLVDRQLEKGEQPVAVMRAAIIPTIRNLYTASILKEERLPVHNYNAFAAAINSLPENMRCLIPQKKDGTPNAYPVFLAIQQVSLNGFTRDWLRAAMTACFEADKSLVTANLDNTVVLHKLVVQLCDRKKLRTSGRAGN